jgi:glucose-1-phosphate thymidylyltransferase
MARRAGVILAGGNGTRLGTGEMYPKAAALVYDKPAIHYPLTTLAEMGCDSAVVVASPEGVGPLAKYIKDGEDYGLDVEFVVQNAPRGVGDAISRTATRVEGVFPLILGDCYYDPAPPVQEEATLYWHDFPGGTNHSVWHPESGAIIEKPRLVDIGRRAVISYFYDERIFDFIKSMKPTPGSGELEIVDIHNFYRMEGAQMLEYIGFFGDMGTPLGLHTVASHIARKKNGAYL